MRRLNRLPAPVIYAAAMAWTKGLAMLSVPLLTRTLAPAEFGRLELLSSAAEIGGLIAGAGLIDTLYRFANGPDGRAQAGRVTGLALLIVVIGMVLLTLAAPFIAAAMPLATSSGEIMLLGAAVVLEGVIGVPLGWMRMHGRAGAFAMLTGLRATLQVALMAALVLGGFGVSGVLAAGAVAGFLLAGVLTAGQARATGISFDGRQSLLLLAYGVPLVGGGLAAFVLGTADRWFLAGRVSGEALGWYGLAVKIAMIVPLLVQPFELWWYPRRLAVLSGPDGRAQSSRVVMAAMAMLMIAAGAVALAGPALVALLAPASYAPAGHMVPFLALALALQLASSMANVGCYARRTGTQALLVNVAAAAVALDGYAAFIPGYGVEGAIAATVLAQAARFAIFALLSQRSAPLDWQVMRLLAVFAVSVAAVVVSGAAGWALLVLGVAVAEALNLVKLPAMGRLRLLSV